MHFEGIGVYNIYNKVGKPGRPAPSMRGVGDGRCRCSLFIGVDVLEIRCKVTINNYFDTAAGAEKNLEKPDVSFFNFYMIKTAKNESFVDLKTFELIFFGCSLRF